MSPHQLFATMASQMLLLVVANPPPAMQTSFSANLRQTLLIQLVRQSAEEDPTSSSSNRIAQLGKRATEPSGNGRRSMASRKSQQGHNNRNGGQSQQQRHHQQQCERLTERQKYARLESVGGRNQQFMANSPREAARNFPSLLPDQQETTIGKDHDSETAIFLDPQGDDPQRLLGREAQILGLQCDQRCREIHAKLQRALATTNTDWDWPERLLMELPQDDDGGTIVFAGGPGGGGGFEATASAGLGRRGGCRLERFVPIGNCTEHGFEEAQGSEKLCTACQGIFLLNRNCFPLFVNSVVCGRHELECIYDRMSGSAQGKCRPKMLSFKVMFNRGTTECERWSFEFLEVPVACECYLSKRSVWLEAAPPPSAVEEH